jgi:DNA modification methylase
MQKIPDKSIDMILCDLPYGTTRCKWDAIIPLELLWEQYKRIIKENGAIVLFGSEPFSSALRTSNIEDYKYDWKWIKTKPSGHLNAKKQPMRACEDVIVFYKKQCIYNPQGLIYGEFNNNRPSRSNKIEGEYTFGQEKDFGISAAKGYPKNILNYANPNNNLLHPTQKPVDLCEYLIKTYTNESELVLDNCMGSGTTAISCINTNRNYIGFELDKKYFDIANQRINDTIYSKNIAN